MAGRGRPGRPPQSDNRERFARLIERGVGNAEACRAVGVHPKTGKRWRLGRAITSSGGRRRHYPPVISARKLEVSPRFLSEDERVRIADLRRAGMGVRAIGGQLGRSPSTISRELRRNCERASGQYRPFAAHPAGGGRLRDRTVDQHVPAAVGEQFVGVPAARRSGHPPSGERGVEFGHGRVVPAQNPGLVDGLPDSGHRHRRHRPQFDVELLGLWLQQPPERCHGQPGPVKAGLEPAQMRGDQGRAGARVRCGQHLADLAQGHIQLAQPVDDLRGGNLLAGVVAVSAVRVDDGWFEQAPLVVSAQRTDAQVSDLRELADGEAGPHEATVHPLPGGRSTDPAGLDPLPRRGRTVAS